MGDFYALEYWQHNGAPSWPLNPGLPYLVQWAGGEVRIVVGDDGRFADDVSRSGPTVTGRDLDPSAGSPDRGMVGRSRDASPGGRMLRARARRCRER